MKEFKKLSVLILALLMVVFTVACGTDKNKNNANDMANKGNTTAETTDNKTAEATTAADDTGVLDPNDTAGPGTGGNSTVADNSDNPVGDVVDGVTKGVEDVVDGVADGVDDMTGNDTTHNTNTNAAANP